MTEFAALSLRLQEQGGKVVVDRLNEIEKRGKTSSASLDQVAASLKGIGTSTTSVQSAAAATVKWAGTQKELSKEVAEGTRLFALQARTVDVGSKSAVRELRSAAAAQREWLKAMGASTEQQLKFGAAVGTFDRRVNVFESQQRRMAAAAAQSAQRQTEAAQRAAQAQATAAERAAQAQAAALARTEQKFIGVQGNLVGMGRAGLTAFNALAFGVQQFATTGEASMRSVATSMAGVLAFLGPQGAIASGVLSMGLIFTDVFTTARKNVRDLITEIGKARLTSGQLAEESARESLAKVQEELKGLRGAQTGELTASGFFKSLQFMKGGLAEEIKKLEAAEIAAAENVERANRASAMSRLDLLKQLRDAGRANATQLQEIAAIEARLGRDRTTANLTLEEQVGLLDKGQKKVKEKTLDAAKAFDTQFTALLALADQGRLTVETYGMLQAAQAALTIVVAQGTGSIEDQVKALAQLKAAQAAIGAAPAFGKGTGADISGKKSGPADKINVKPITQFELDNSGLTDDEIAAGLESLRLEESIRQTLGSAIANGISGAFEDGLSAKGLLDGFKAMTASILGQLGSAAIQIGLQTQAIAKLLASARAFLVSNPVAAIAIGAALVALGGALGGSSHGGGGGGSAGQGTSFSGSSESTRLFVSSAGSGRTQSANALGAQRAASAAAPVTINAMLLNPNDHASQRLLAQAVRAGERKGL